MKTEWTAKKLIAFEEKVAKEFLKGKINCPIHLSGGNEQQLIDIFSGVSEEDWIVSTHRNHYHYLLKGGSAEELLHELRGCSKGVCCGVGRSMHIFDKRINFITSAIVAGGCAISVGLALGIKLKQGKGGVWCFIGDGAEDSGHTWEAVKYSEAFDLPITFVVEDNGLSISTPTHVRKGSRYTIEESNKMIRYTYERRWPHVGCGKHVSF